MDEDRLTENNIVTEGESPCLSCGDADWCDRWEAQFCCDRCVYIYEGDTPCEDCNRLEI